MNEKIMRKKLKKIRKKLMRKNIATRDDVKHLMGKISKDKVEHLKYFYDREMLIETIITTIKNGETIFDVKITG